MASVHAEEAKIDSFVGRVMSRPSPVLTWRPTKVQRITLDPKASHVAADVVEVEESPDPPQRFSRLSTQRMVAWPVVRQVGATRGAWLRTVAARAASVTALAGVLAGGAYAAYVTLVPGRIVTPVSSKEVSVHALRGGGDDTLVVAPLVATVEEVRADAAPTAKPVETKPAETKPAHRKHAHRVASAPRR